MRSMYSGVSGLKNMQTSMDVIGNNISNVNTNGYKSSSVNFSDILSQTIQGASSPQGTTGGTNPRQIGLGMSVASISTNFADGNFQSTGKQEDMAIGGSGFFVLQNGNDKLYTRAGSFSRDSAGNYVAPGGFKLMGWTADANGTLNAGGALQAINVPIGTALAAQESKKISMSKNLKGDAPVGYSYTAAATVADSLGTQHKVNTSYYKVAIDPATKTSTWLTYTSVSDPTVNGTVTNQWQSVTFDATGALQKVQSITPAATPTDSLTLTGLNLDPTKASTSTQTFSSITNGKPEMYKLAFTADSSSANTWSYTLSNGDGTSTNTGIVKYTPPGTTAAASGAPSLGGYSFFQSDGKTPAVMTAGNLTVTPSTIAAGIPVAGGFSITPVETANVTAAITAGTAAAAFTAQFNNGSNQMSITRDLTQLTQYGGLGDSSLYEEGDGYSAGTLSATSLDSSGIITGTYTNGQHRALAQVALAAFANSEGLTKEGAGNYSVSSNSGQPEVGTASTGGRGTLTGGGLEMSNVDLAKEFSDMIITERGYQANSKIITTSDEMLQDLNNLKR